MTTTELIEILKKVEFGASGRPREITLVRLNSLSKEFDIIHTEEELFKINSTGDGCSGAELSLSVCNATQRSCV